MTFNLDVRLHKRAAEPGILFAAEGLGRVVEAKVADDPRACWIGGVNCRRAVEKPIALIEVRGLSDVCGDKRVILPALGDAVDLNGQKDRDPLFFQRPCEPYCLPPAPAAPVTKYPARPLFP